MKKQIFMALLAAVSSFAMVSCGDDDKNNDPKPDVSKEAKYEQTSNSVSVQYYYDMREMGGESIKNEYTFSNGLVTSHTATVTCSSSVVAELAYQGYLEDKENGETDDDAIKNVTRKGDQIIVEYVVEEGMTEMDAIIASKLMANLWGEKVELTKEEQAYMNQGNDGNNGDYDDIPDDFGGITEGE
ncbi:MAG: hypothetical protein J6W37_11770 [Bacteroidales bacterium]|nr:hypothetical protein [Bacteroidales bacterium]